METRSSSAAHSVEGNLSNFIAAVHAMMQQRHQLQQQVLQQVQAQGQQQQRALMESIQQQQQQQHDSSSFRFLDPHQQDTDRLAFRVT